MATPNFKSVREANPTRSYAFYGPSGTGKTTIAGSFPKPILFIDINDQGTDSVLELDEDEAKVLQPEDFDALEECYWYLVKGDHPFKTVVIDTITEMQTLYIQHLLKQKDRKVDDIGSWGALKLQEWGEVSGAMNSWITHFRNLPVEVIFNAQQRIFNRPGDEEDDYDEYEEAEEVIVPEVGPRLIPSVKDHLNAMVSVLGSTFIRRRYKEVKKGNKKVKVKKDEYCLRVGPNPYYATKLRKPKAVDLPEVIVDPTYDEILEVIQGE